jgi:hypothetical protein
MLALEPIVAPQVSCAHSYRRGLTGAPIDSTICRRVRQQPPACRCGLLPYFEPDPGVSTMPRYSHLLLLMLVSLSAHAELTVNYKGTFYEGGKDVPATAFMSYTGDRVAMGMASPTRRYRMIFDVRSDLLTLVDDSNLTYVEMPGGIANTMQAQMKAQLDRIPPAQRQMAEQMMRNMPGAAAQPVEPDTYVRTTTSEERHGYTCTWVMIMQGQVKRAAYCGSSSPDFALSGQERAAAVGFAHALGNSSILVRDTEQGGLMRMFEWDSQKEGYPIVTQCFRGERVNVNLEFASSSRDQPPKELFDIPQTYRKQAMAPP